MERRAAKFSSHEEAAHADAQYYRSLTPQQRLEVLMKIIEQAHPDLHDPAKRLQRVYRIVKFES